MNTPDELPQDAEQQHYGISVKDFIAVADKMVLRSYASGYLAPMGLIALDALSTLSWQRALPAAVATTAATIYASIILVNGSRNSALGHLNNVCDDTGALLQNSEKGRERLRWAADLIDSGSCETAVASGSCGLFIWGAVKATGYSLFTNFSSQADPHAFGTSHPVLTWLGSAALVAVTATSAWFHREIAVQTMDNIEKAIRPEKSPTRSASGGEQLNS